MHGKWRNWLTKTKKLSDHKIHLRSSPLDVESWWLSLIFCTWRHGFFGMEDFRCLPPYADSGLVRRSLDGWTNKKIDRQTVGRHSVGYSDDKQIIENVNAHVNVKCMYVTECVWWQLAAVLSACQLACQWVSQSVSRSFRHSVTGKNKICWRAFLQMDIQLVVCLKTISDSLSAHAYVRPSMSVLPWRTAWTSWPAVPHGPKSAGWLLSTFSRTLMRVSTGISLSPTKNS